MSSSLFVFDKIPKEDPCSQPITHVLQSLPERATTRPRPNTLYSRDLHRHQITPRRPQLISRHSITFQISTAQIALLALSHKTCCLLLLLLLTKRVGMDE